MAIATTETYQYELYTHGADEHDDDAGREISTGPKLRLVGGRAYESARVSEELGLTTQEPVSASTKPTRPDHVYGPAEARMREMMRRGLI